MVRLQDALCVEVRQKGLGGVRRPDRAVSVKGGKRWRGIRAAARDGFCDCPAGIFRPKRKLAHKPARIYFDKGRPCRNVRCRAGGHRHENKHGEKTKHHVSSSIIVSIEKQRSWQVIP